MSYYEKPVLAFGFFSLMMVISNEQTSDVSCPSTKIMCYMIKGKEFLIANFNENPICSFSSSLP